MTTCARFLAPLVLAALASAQTTWVVDLFNRPGAHFTDLPAAVAQAANGDVLLLRATTADLVDSYEAPTIRGKGLTILGETGAGLPRVAVTGIWTVDSLPAGATMIVSNLHMTFGNGRLLRLNVTNCVGGVVLKAVGPMGFNFFTQPNLRDNALIVVSDSLIDTSTGPIAFVRCKAMMDNVQLIRTNPGAGANGASITLLDSDLHVAGCDLRGANGNSLNAAGSPVVQFLTGTTSGALYIAKSCRLEAGVSTFGGRETAIIMAANANDCMRYNVYRDPSAVLVEGYPGYCMPITAIPVSGLRTSTNQSVLQIHHDTTPNAPAILLMAPLQPAPWNNIIGPCFLDQNFVWSSLDLAPAAGPLTRTFTIPPTIPLGHWVSVQAFEYEILRNRVIGTNVTIVGVL